jgi:hypothetical protein
MKSIHDEDGQALVMTAFCMLVLLGFIALAVDVGTLYNAKRKVQIAADASAIAGALEMVWGNSANAVTQAQTAGTNNGITNVNQIAVTPSPTDGYHQGSGFIEVVVTQPNPTAFMGMFMPGTVNVAARAVAGITASTACIYLLDPTAEGALTMAGSGALDASQCGIDINSNNPAPICITGNKASQSLDTPYIRVRGGSVGTSQKCNKAPSSPILTDSGKITDPLAGLAGPTTCDHTVTATTLTLGASDPNATLTGTICFSNTVKISGTGNLPGTVYRFNAGVEITTGANITVPAGTFDLEGGALTPNGGPSCLKSSGNTTTFVQDSNSELKITAPDKTSTSAYKGIAIMQPASISTPLELQFGSSGSSQYGGGVFNGIIYAPASQVYFHDNGGSTSAAGLISDTLNLCSSSLTITSYNNYPNNASPLISVQLVE